MTLLSYQVFKAVVEQGSFLKAAEVLGITPSAVSHAISSMESELGTPLFIRSKLGNSLTGFGRNLLPYINSVLASEQNLQQAISELNGTKSGKVRLGTFSSTCTNWVPDIIRSFAAEYPNVEIIIYEGTYGDVTGWLKSGIIDLGYQSMSACPDLPFEALHLDPLLCILPKDYKKKEPYEYITFDEVRHKPFIMLQESVDADIKSYLTDHQLIYASNCHIEDDLSALVMVANGLGYTIMPEMVLKGIPYDISVYPFEHPGFRVVGLAALNFETLSPVAKALYRHIVTMYKQKDLEQKFKSLAE